MRRKSPGYTLSEVMLTVAIIGLLSAIAVPSIWKPRSTAHKSYCINNLRLIENAKEHWAVDNLYRQDETPTAEEIADYIRGGIASLRCPDAEVRTFSTSYTINEMGISAVCKIDPDRHNIYAEAYEEPEEEKGGCGGGSDPEPESGPPGGGGCEG